MADEEDILEGAEKDPESKDLEDGEAVELDPLSDAESLEALVEEEEEEEELGFEDEDEM